MDRLMRANQEELTEVDGIGGVLAEAWTGYFASEKNRESLENLLKELIIEQEQMCIRDRRMPFRPSFLK